MSTATCEDTRPKLLKNILGAADTLSFPEQLVSALEAVAACELTERALRFGFDAANGAAMEYLSAPRNQAPLQKMLRGEHIYKAIEVYRVEPAEPILPMVDRIDGIDRVNRISGIDGIDTQPSVGARDDGNGSAVLSQEQKEQQQDAQSEAVPGIAQQLIPERARPFAGQHWLSKAVENCPPCLGHKGNPDAPLKRLGRLLLLRETLISRELTPAEVDEAARAWVSHWGLKVPPHWTESYVLDTVDLAYEKATTPPFMTDFVEDCWNDATHTKTPECIRTAFANKGELFFHLARFFHECQLYVGTDRNGPIPFSVTQSQIAEAAKKSYPDVTQQSVSVMMQLMERRRAGVKILELASKGFKGKASRWKYLLPLDSFREEVPHD